MSYYYGVCSLARRLGVCTAVLLYFCPFPQLSKKRIRMLYSIALGTASLGVHRVYIFTASTRDSLFFRVSATRTTRSLRGR